MGEPPHVVIVGGGFGGLTAAQSLRRAKVRVTVVDRANHHVFQPLLYQVAMAGLSPAEIASPIRSILARQRNARVLLGEATGVDFVRKTLQLADGELGFDVLVLATGARTSWFGHDEWSRHALSLKSLADAIASRERGLLAFERAERATDPAERARLLTFVSIGGGPTGVELAGSIAELARFVLARDFRNVDPKEARVVLLEAGPRIFPTFAPDLSDRAVDQLRSLGVDTRTGARVTAIDERGVALGDERIDAATVVWAAGVRAAPLAERLGLPCDRAGRVQVEPDLSLPGQRDCFAIGDMAAFLDERGQQLPGISAVAMQQARAVAASIVRDVGHVPRSPFVFRDPGSMATIGRSRAICELGRLHLSGFVAWLFWLLVHLWFLIGFRNRFVVMFSWTWSYFTYRRGARLITHVQPAPPTTR
ncbi:MAG: NAD(P)/FAD-dependent oxidoreductase [Polyangiales bacterium]